MTGVMKQNPSDIKPRSREWEVICQRCGRCCYEKYDYRGTIHYTKTPCEFFNPATRRCRVYARRQQLQPGCAQLTIVLIQRGILPKDCPYVRQFGAGEGKQ